MSSDVICPYCDADIEICHDDGFGYDEGVLHEYECPECEKSFVFETSISIDHYAHPADCLNTEEDIHKWELTHTYPRRFVKWRCSECGAEKEATLKEISVKYPDVLEEGFK